MTFEMGTQEMFFKRLASLIKQTAIQLETELQKNSMGEAQRLVESLAKEVRDLSELIKKYNEG